MSRDQERSVAFAYAKAALSVSVQHAEDWSISLELLSGALKNKMLAHAFAGAFVTVQHAPGVMMDALRQQGFTECFCRFVQVVAEYRRLALLDEISAFYLVLKSEHDGEYRASITLAHEHVTLSKTVEKSIQRAFGVPLTFTYEVDTSLLAGFMVQQGYKRLDASFAARLERLKNNIGLEV